MPHFFISYRRLDQEGRYLAHMVFRELRGRYGEQSVFLDVDSLSPGLSFPDKVARALEKTDVVLVIIGPEWVRLLNERQADSRDWVRYEVAQSLARPWLPVVPVCCPGVQVPRADELPDDLKDLGVRDGIVLDPFQDFDSHLQRFLANVERMLKEQREGRRERKTRRPIPTPGSPGGVTAPLPNAPTAAQSVIASAPARQAEKRKDRASTPRQPVTSPTDPPVSAEYVANIRKFADEVRTNNRNAHVYAWVAMPLFGWWVGTAEGLLAGVASTGVLLIVGYVALWFVARAHARKLSDMVHAQDLTPTQRVDLARRLKDVNSPVLQRILSDLTS
jgi:hypothetical protein